MKLLAKLIYLSSVIILVNSGAPDCGIRNQFRGYCFSFDYCTNSNCDSEKCGQFQRHSTLLRIQQSRIIPQCAITNSTTLRTITGINSNIHVLASGSFANLPNLESILLPYNLIRELHYGIFYNVNVKLLDLSWNKIIYISEGAFNGITGLKYLNLSRNELSTLPVEQLPRSLAEINLSHNFLERIALNGAKWPDLTSVNLSHNSLEHVALSFDNTLHNLDMTQNRLNNIDFYDINDCENLKIPSNLFSEVPQFFQYSRIKRVALHPNPWKCDQLQRLWIHLQNNNIQEETSNNNVSQPLCSLDSSLVSSRIMNFGLQVECEDDSHCEHNLLCRSSKCWDPCNSACHDTNICEVSNHVIECVCSNNKKKNPRETFSPCYDVECFSETDCMVGQYCSGNQICKTIPVFTGISSSYGSYSAGFSLPGSTSVISSGSSSSYTWPDSPQPQISSQPGYYGTPMRSPSSSPNYAYSDVGYINTLKPAGIEIPWWFSEIPKTVPTNTINHN